MEQPGTRRQRQERTREALLLAAAQVFARRGFHGATLPEIAQAAGCSTGAVYSNFKGKEDLFLALLGWVARALRDEQRAAQGSDSRELFQHAATQWIRQLDAYPETMLLLVEFWLYAARNPQVRPRLAERFDEVRTTLAALVSAVSGIGQPYARDAAYTAQAMGYGFAMLRAVDPDQGTDEAGRDRFARAVGWLYDAVTAEAEAGPAEPVGPGSPVGPGDPVSLEDSVGPERPVDPENPGSKLRGEAPRAEGAPDGRE